jgi:hypothetical protein
MLEDVSPTFDNSVTKSILEITMELVTEVRSVTERHRRMTHEKLNQSGRGCGQSTIVCDRSRSLLLQAAYSAGRQAKRKKSEAFGSLYRPGQKNYKEDRRQRHVVPDSLQTPRCGQGLQREAGMLILKKEMKDFSVAEIEVPTSS